jgi:hypothetical protein
MNVDHHLDVSHIPRQGQQVSGRQSARADERDAFADQRGGQPFGGQGQPADPRGVTGSATKPEVSGRQPMPTPRYQPRTGATRVAGHAPRP